MGPQPWSHAYKFEREIEAKFKVKHAVAVNSGTAALHAALNALDLKGREVITSPLTFSATASAILMAGGVPRFCDVNPHTFTIGKEEVKKHVTKKTAAILPVHLFGYFPDLSDLRRLGLPIVEDACQAVGASRGGVFAGTYGLAGGYSFNGTKAIPSGEGGCLVTNSDKIAEKARLLVNHGENFNSDIGYNYRMHEVVACIARHGLRELDERNQRRRELVNIAQRAFEPVFYDDRMEPIGPDMLVPVDASHVCYVYPFVLDSFVDRPRFISRCAKRGLTIQESYTTPLHHLKAFRKYATRELPVVEELHRKTLCLVTTLTPEKPLSYARKVAEIIRGALE